MFGFFRKFKFKVGEYVVLDSAETAQIEARRWDARGGYNVTYYEEYLVKNQYDNSIKWVPVGDIAFSVSYRELQFYNKLQSEKRRLNNKINSLESDNNKLLNMILSFRNSFNWGYKNGDKVEIVTHQNEKLRGKIMYAFTIAEIIRVTGAHHYFDSLNEKGNCVLLPTPNVNERLDEMMPIWSNQIRKVEE